MPGEWIKDLDRACHGIFVFSVFRWMMVILMRSSSGMWLDIRDIFDI